MSNKALFKRLDSFNKRSKSLWKKLEKEADSIKTAFSKRKGLSGLRPGMLWSPVTEMLDHLRPNIVRRNRFVYSDTYPRRIIRFNRDVDKGSLTAIHALLAELVFLSKQGRDLEDQSSALHTQILAHEKTLKGLQGPLPAYASILLPEGMKNSKGKKVKHLKMKRKKTKDKS